MVFLPQGMRAKTIAVPFKLKGFAADNHYKDERHSCREPNVYGGRHEQAACLTP